MSNLWAQGEGHTGQGTRLLQTQSHIHSLDNLEKLINTLVWTGNENREAEENMQTPNTQGRHGD